MLGQVLQGHRGSVAQPTDPGAKGARELVAAVGCRLFVFYPDG